LDLPGAKGDLMAKVRGADKHLRRLRGMHPKALKEAGKLVYAMADMHVAEASHLITQGSVSGANHVASAPGQPPNADTQALNRSGHVEKAGPLKALSVFDAPHALPLEFGTSKMSERPFAKPAAKTVRAKSKGLKERAVARIVGGGTL
jgi:hypothetical protein